MDEELYREHILDHYKNPRNKGALSDYSFKHKEYNPLCGDVLELFLRVDEKNRVAETGFEGHGCAINQASASLLTEYIKGKTIDELKTLTTQDILDMLGVPINDARMKCAMLSLKTLEQGLYAFSQ